MAAEDRERGPLGGYHEKLRWLLCFINASIGKRPIASISAHEPLIMLRKMEMESKGRYETAKRLRSACSQIFRYPIATARAERDVAADLRGAHMVPLSRQALETIASIEHDQDYSPFLFPSRLSVERPMSENTINAALRRMRYAQDEMTGHGFRAMAATLLNEMGLWHPDTIERQLAHCDNNAVRRAYPRGEYWDERVRMMQHWSDLLVFLRSGARLLNGRFGEAGRQAPAL